jgi:metal-responsive CopG/Arc/MetJ family transcriptional regulator
MVRALITFKEEQLKKIDRLARKNKQSRAQVVREAIDRYVSQKEKEPTWKEIVAKCAGMWKHKNIDGLEYTNKLREEWER